MKKRNLILILGGIITGVVALCVGAIVLLLVINNLFGFHPPTTADYISTAKSWEPVVVAIYDYRADHGGNSPKDFGDLVPGYLPTVPPTVPWAVISGDSLMIEAAAPHTGLVYSFDPKDEGWTVGGDYGVGKLPMPKLGPSKKPDP